MSEQLVAALIGLVVGVAGAGVQAALRIRERVNEELRSRRLNTYPIVYRLTGALSFWPPAKMNYEELLRLNLDLREWYFTSGGLYLSATSRERYGEMKQLICAYLDELADNENRMIRDVSSDAYEDLADTARAFRNGLTEDLETRRQRSLWWVVGRWLHHRKQHEKWKVRMQKVGGPDREVRPYPLKEMPLPPINSTQTVPAED